MEIREARKMLRAVIPGQEVCVPNRRESPADKFVWRQRKGVHGAGGPSGISASLAARMKPLIASRNGVMFSGIGSCG